MRLVFSGSVVSGNEVILLKFSERQSTDSGLSFTQGFAILICGYEVPLFLTISLFSCNYSIVAS